MMQKRYWKVVIKGPSIQGVMLREAIVGLKEEASLGPRIKDIRGFTRNFEDWVEAIFTCDRETAKSFLEGIKRIPSSEKSMGIIQYEGEPQLSEIESPEGLFSEKDFSCFRVKREGEQKEMMLALQGAGKLFKKSADIQQNVSRQLRERDEKKVIGSLLSMRYEIDGNRDAINSRKPELVFTTALGQGLTTPPIAEKGFVFELAELSRKLNEYRILGIGIGEESIPALMKALDSFEKTLKTELEARHIKMD